MMKDEMVLIKRSTLEFLCSSIRNIKKEIEEIKTVHSPEKRYYDNDGVREILNVNDKLIRKYRELGLLGYHHKDGKKYWYSSDDIENFLQLCKVKS